jgi:hypothetical protein
VLSTHFFHEHFALSGEFSPDNVAADGEFSETQFRFCRLYFEKRKDIFNSWFKFLTRERQTVNAIKDFYFGWRN